MQTMTDRVEEARRSWNAGDLAGYLTLYDPAIRLHGYAPDPFDKVAVTSFYELLWASLGYEGRPNPQLDFFETLENGDLYSCRFMMTGVHRGPFLGAPATGRSYALNGITILRFAPEHGTVVERFSSADMLGLLVQIGALPPPA